MPRTAPSERRNWIMTGWSSLWAVMITGLLFLSIYETRTATDRLDAPAYAVEPTGERLLY
jgi:hypothetical protein